MGWASYFENLQEKLSDGLHQRFYETGTPVCAVSFNEIQEFIRFSFSEALEPFLEAITAPGLDLAAELVRLRTENAALADRQKLLDAQERRRFAVANDFEQKIDKQKSTISQLNNDLKRLLRENRQLAANNAELTEELAAGGGAQFFQMNVDKFPPTTEQ